MDFFQLFVILAAALAVKALQPLVSIPGLGRVSGRTAFSKYSRRPIYQFLGIRYAESPRGAKRFQLPEEVQPWTELLDASSYAPACPSFTNLAEVAHEERVRDVEDCLTVSIHTANLYKELPVMFYIHGEFFFDGSSEEAQPHYLLEKDVVLVSVQYRLAPFGFLTTKSKEMPGNIAAWDVLLALDWTRKHIRHFGGDYKQITLFGQGSGATLAHLLMITPLIDQPIFKRAILQSGSMLSPYFLNENPFEHTMNVAEKANCIGATTITSVNNCLLRLTPSQLIQAYGIHARMGEDKGIGHYGGFQWTIGDPLGLLPMHPSKLIRQPRSFHYPVMGGVTKNVGSFFFGRQIIQRLQLPPNSHIDVEEIIEIVLKHSIGDDDFGIWKTLAIENLFEPDQIANSTLAALEPGLIDLLSNIHYKGPVLQAIQMNSKFLPNDTFLYTFDYRGQFSRYQKPGSQFHRVSISDENLYIFPYPTEYANLGKEDTNMSNNVVDLWTSFAINGIPETEAIEEWPPVTMVTGPYLAIDTELVIRYDFIDEMTRTNRDEDNLG